VTNFIILETNKLISKINFSCNVILVKLANLNQMTYLNKKNIQILNNKLKC